jgi:hypothetical protein
MISSSTGHNQNTHIPGLLQSHDGTTIEPGKDGPHGREVVQIQALLETSQLCPKSQLTELTSANLI